MEKIKRIATFRDYIGEATVIYKRTSKPIHQVTSSSSAIDFLRPLYDECMDDHEEIKVLHLSRANGVVNVDHVAKGGDTSCNAPIRNIVRNALYIKTDSVIICHNHPSGKLEGSHSDNTLCKKLKDAFELMDMRVLDFLIITREGYLSYADEGNL